MAMLVDKMKVYADFPINTMLKWGEWLQSLVTKKKQIFVPTTETETNIHTDN